MAATFLDSSALVKLVVEEPESAFLRNYLRTSDLVACELVLTEVPRAIRRAAFPGEVTQLLLDRAGLLLDAVALLPLTRAILLEAGRLPTPGLRSLDAIHVAAAVSLGGIDDFVTYDERQGAAARLAGLRTAAPAP